MNTANVDYAGQGTGARTMPPMVERRETFGPITRRLQYRALSRWGMLAVSGLALGLTGSSALTAFGIGLVLPGAGLLYGGHPWMALVTVLLIPVSLLLWLIVGAAIAPVVLWLGAALLGAGLVDPQALHAWVQPAAPILAGTLAGLVALRNRQQADRRIAKVRALNAHFVTRPVPRPALEYPVAPPLDEEDIGALRFALDLALQPIDKFDGFTTIDQFREAAWRYQLYALTESLSALRATRLPNFSGYFEQAQRNAVMKMTDKRVWKYWFYENLWGNLSLNPDPMVRENIMISGWYALALGAYQITTGDRSIDAPGALPFKWNERRTFDYSYPKIAETLVRNFDKDQLCLFPCEPNWVFSYCNEEGIAGLMLYDRMHGTDHAARLAQTFRNRIDHEFTMADGKMVVIYANKLGLPIGGRGAGLYAGSCWLRNMYAPDLAHRTWEQVRHEFLTGDLGDYQLGGTDKVDSGDYKKSEGNLFFPLMMAAANEMGDDEVYGWAHRRHNALGSQFANGARRWPGSTFANLTANMGRFGMRDTWHRFAHVDYPRAWREGPCLTGIAYPDVIVAHAVSDGEALDIVIEPGAGPLRTTLGFERLRPERRYQLGDFEAFEADAIGTGAVEIDLGERISLRLRPLI